MPDRGPTARSIFTRLRGGDLWLTVLALLMVPLAVWAVEVPRVWWGYGLGLAAVVWALAVLNGIVAALIRWQLVSSYEAGRWPVPRLVTTSARGHRHWFLALQLGHLAIALTIALGLIRLFPGSAFGAAVAVIVLVAAACLVVGMMGRAGPEVGLGAHRPPTGNTVGDVLFWRQRMRKAKVADLAYAQREVRPSLSFGLSNAAKGDGYLPIDPGDRPGEATWPEFRARAAASVAMARACLLAMMFAAAAAAIWQPSVSWTDGDPVAGLVVVRADHGGSAPGISREADAPPEPAVTPQPATGARTQGIPEPSDQAMASALTDEAPGNGREGSSSAEASATAGNIAGPVEQTPDGTIESAEPAEQASQHLQSDADVGSDGHSTPEEDADTQIADANGGASGETVPEDAGEPSVPSEADGASGGGGGGLLDQNNIASQEQEVPVACEQVRPSRWSQRPRLLLSSVPVPAKTR